MQKGLAYLVLFSITILIIAIYSSRIGMATEAEGYKSTSLALGRFRNIDLNGAFQSGKEAAGNEQAGQILLKTKGLSDVYVQSNTWAPGGSTGWHTHPGQSLVIVTAGAVTDYEGYDSECRPHVYPKGMGFVDPGGEHVHNLRNEGKVEAKTIAVQFLSADASRRIDVADPGTCQRHR